MCTCMLPGNSCHVAMICCAMLACRYAAAIVACSHAAMLLWVPNPELRQSSTALRPRSDPEITSSDLGPCPKEGPLKVRSSGNGRTLASRLLYPVVIINWGQYLGPPGPFSFPDSRDPLEVLGDLLGREENSILPLPECSESSGW